MSVTCAASESLTQIILNCFKKHRQTDDQYQKKKKLEQEIEKILCENGYVVKVYLFGSTVTKLGTKDADVRSMRCNNQPNPESKSKEVKNKTAL